MNQGLTVKLALWRKPIINLNIILPFFQRGWEWVCFLEMEDMRSLTRANGHVYQFFGPWPGYLWKYNESSVPSFQRSLHICREVGLYFWVFLRDVLLPHINLQLEEELTSGESDHVGQWFSKYGVRNLLKTHIFGSCPETWVGTQLFVF